MMRETILITGASGTIGSALTSMLIQEGFAIIAVTRDPSRQKSETEGLRWARWDPREGYIDQWAIEQADHIINLAGAGVADKRWSSARKMEIVESRVQSGRTLASALKAIPNKVRTVIQASAIGWYGDDGDSKRQLPFTEDDPVDPHFLGNTCFQWEQSIASAGELGKRLVTFRIGIVLTNRGGAYKEFLLPLRFGVATVLGNGRQMVSWIHVRDLCRMFLFALQQQGMQGTYNAVAPHPVSNRQLIQEFARRYHRRPIMTIQVPAFVLKIMLGEMSIEVLKSATVSADRIQSKGFVFDFPTISVAVQSLQSDSLL